MPAATTKPPCATYLQLWWDSCNRKLTDSFLLVQIKVSYIIHKTKTNFVFILYSWGLLLLLLLY